jgi:formylglycine-generating enzyme required for sulfatase activity
MTAEEASDFCDKLTARDQQSRKLQAGWKYKLPTKDQWYYVAHLSGIPADNAKIMDYAWVTKNSPAPTSSPVGTRGSAPQIPGLYDIVGNVWELTSTPTDTGDGYVIAGGAFNEPREALLANLNGDFPQSLAKDGRRKNTGFRVILVPD